MKYHVLSAALLVLSLLVPAGCGGGGGGGGPDAPSVDTSQFRVYNTDPAPGTGNIDDTSRFTIFFTRPVEEKSFGDGTISLTRRVDGKPKGGTLSFSPDGKLVTFHPDGRLDLKTTYLLTVRNEVLDQSGSPLVETYVASYTTSPLPAPELIRQGDFRTLRSHLIVGRCDHTATLVTVSGGKRYVLVTGGFTRGRSLPTATTESVDVDDLPASEDDGFIFANAGDMKTPRVYHTATAYRADNGLVLVAGGGQGGDGTTALSEAEIWSLAAGRFVDTASMNRARRLHTATLITGTGTNLDGQILVTGGLPTETAGNTAEVFDPTTETWTLLSERMNFYRYGHRAVLLRTGPLAGKVLLVGGELDDEGYIAEDFRSEIFDPATRTFRVVDAPPSAWRWLLGAVELATGQVLITDGGEQKGELFNPFDETMTTVQSANRLQRRAPVVFRFSFPPSRRPAAFGPIDNVLLLGGAMWSSQRNEWIAHSDVEQFVLGNSGSGQYFSSDPAEGGIDLGDARGFSAGCDLGDGRLLVTGGVGVSTIGQPPPTGNVDSVLLFDPEPE